MNRRRFYWYVLPESNGRSDVAATNSRSTVRCGYYRNGPNSPLDEPVDPLNQVVLPHQELFELVSAAGESVLLEAVDFPLYGRPFALVPEPSEAAGTLL